MIVGVSVLLAAGWLLAALLRGPSVWIGFVICAAFAAVGLYLTFGIVAVDEPSRPMNTRSTPAQVSMCAAKIDST